jgi:hypothetical protein
MPDLEQFELEAPPEEEARIAHAAAMGPNATARGIAYSAVAIAHKDTVAACNAIRTGTIDEALEILAECKTQIEAAERMLSGKMWML